MADVAMRAPIDEMERARASLYRLLGAALSHPPTAALLGALRALPRGDRMAGLDDSPVAAALGRIADLAQAATLDAAQVEYGALFVGIARGELMPYASFYLTGFLHDRPLMRLRQEMAVLGLAASPGHTDPEDHAGTVCELMAGLIDGDYGMVHGAPQPLDGQRRFFDRHMAPWLEQFFTDLETAPAARLYASVGTLGRVFFSVERLAFQMEAP